MTKQHAEALLALIAELYLVLSADDPAPPEAEPAMNGQAPDKATVG